MADDNTLAYVRGSAAVAAQRTLVWVYRQALNNAKTIDAVIAGMFHAISI